MTTSIKATAAVTAANKSTAALVHANEAIAKLAADYVARTTGMIGKAQLECAMKARTILAREPEANVKPLTTAFGRQRKHDIGAVLGASDETLMGASELFPKTRKPGLQQMARGIALVLAGIKDDGAANRYLSSGKKADFLTATGQKADPITPVEGEGDKDVDATESRTTAHNVPAESAVGNLKRVLDLMPALEAEMADYGPECKKAMVAFLKAAALLSKAAANG
jgi:hypothetical protein